MFRWLRQPEKTAVQNLDDPSTTQLHGRLIKEKYFLKKIYDEVYCRYKEIVDRDPQGHYIELGSGGGFVKEAIAQVKTSDVLPLPNNDYCFSALDMPFEDRSVDGFFMFNVFHHVKDPRQFLKEMQRCLKPGGKVLMIEPANTLWGRFIWKNFHHEVFDPSAAWKIEGTGHLSDANGALPWIVFCRDRQKFLQEFPAFTMGPIHYLMPLRYIFSGGFTMRQLLPNFCYPLIQFVEWILTPFCPLTAMYVSIELEKRSF